MMRRFFESPPYAWGKGEKTERLSERLAQLSAYHEAHCAPYGNIARALGSRADDAKSYYDMPFIPVSLFKELDLKSVPDADIIKTMTSSGTTGQAVSRIFLNKETVSLQQKALARIVTDFLGASRLPMLIIDCPSVIRDRAMFSARGAGILGFSIFGADRTYALKDDMSLDRDALDRFAEKYRGRPKLLFGFTFMIWQHLIAELSKTGEKIDLSDGTLIHGGGWKKLARENVSTETFKGKLRELCGVADVHDYYGMVEQTGSIYMECPEGHLHASIFSDVITRRYEDFSVCDFGETGIIQALSVLPESYPGHSLLTEDEGVVLGEDDCPCGRKGKYFKVLGRLKNAEIRGCSDTYAATF
jgi:phenylacetate-coenzyme A ligase PaaK-like adenylate-forming protein